MKQIPHHLRYVGVNGQQLLVMASDKIIRETFRYWVLSFFPEWDVIDLPLDMHPVCEIPPHEVAHMVCVPLVFTSRDVQCLQMQIDQWSTLGRSFANIIIVISPNLGGVRKHLELSNLPVTCVTFVGCIRVLAQAMGNDEREHRSVWADGVSEQGRQSLTARERQVLDLIVIGMSMKEVSLAMGISYHTAISHKRNLFLKTGAHSMQQLALYAVLQRL